MASRYGSAVGQELTAVLRAPTERDWPRILELAGLAVAHVSDGSAQTEWLERRRAFEGVQTHSVIHARVVHRIPDRRSAACGDLPGSRLNAWVLLDPTTA